MACLLLLLSEALAATVRACIKSSSLLGISKKDFSIGNGFRGRAFRDRHEARKFDLIQ